MSTWASFPISAGVVALLAISAIPATHAGVVATLGTPTSNHGTGNLPTWNNNGDQQDATFTALIDFSANTTPGSRELVWESGGRINGLSLIYEENNILRFRALQFGVTSELTWQLTANQLAAGDLFVSWVVDLGNDEMRLIMDGINGSAREVVATTTFIGTDWTGSGAAAFGNGTSRTGGYPTPFEFFPDPFASGTINASAGLDYYQDQAFLPSPVPEPLGALAAVAALGCTIFRRQRPFPEHA